MGYRIKWWTHLNGRKISADDFGGGKLVRAVPFHHVNIVVPE